MLTDEQSKLVEDNIKLVYCIAHKYNRPNLFDDMVQEGSMGLICAAQRFNPDLGLKFSTFAYSYIVGYINMFLRRDCVVKPKYINKELSTPVICELPENISVEGDYESVDTIVRNNIYEAITDFQKFILTLTLDGYTQEEIAAITGSQQCKISKELNAIRNNETVIKIASEIYDKGDLENARRAKSRS